MQDKQGQGFLTFAHNTQDVDYVAMAHLLALSVKRTCSINSFAVVITKVTVLTDQQRDVFDHVIEIPQVPKFYSECLAWELTPFKETFKLECDMIVPRSIDHWWDACRLQDVVMTTNVRNYQGHVSDSRAYRRFFDDNNLLDAYNGCMYFRYSLVSKRFFQLARQIFENWSRVRDSALVNCMYTEPDTDVVFGLAGTMVDEPAFIPLNLPTFTHMKGAVNGWNMDMDWRDAVQWHVDDECNLFVGGIAQHYPFHYFQKDFCTPELIEHYAT